VDGKIHPSGFVQQGGDSASLVTAYMYAALRPRDGFSHPHQEHMKYTYMHVQVRCLCCNRSIAGHNLYNLFIFTIDYSQNFTTRYFLAIEHVAMFEVKSIVIQIIGQVYGSVNSLMTRRVVCKVTLYLYITFLLFPLI